MRILPARGEAKSQTVKPTITTSAASALGNGILTIPGQKLPGPVMSARAALFTINATPVVRQNQVVMRQRKRIISGQAATPSTTVRGTPTAQRPASTSGTGIITLCVRDARQLTIQSGALCTAER